MERSHALLSEMTRYPLEECGEGLASIPEAVERAGVEMTFSETKLADRFDRIYFIREQLIESLIAIGHDMNERGWVMRIEEGFRTRRMQTALAIQSNAFDRIVASCVWECGGERPPLDLVQRRSMVLIAQFPLTGTHLCGAAVDISVFRRDDGVELDRGGGYLTMDERTPMLSPFVADEHLRNRQVITEVMEARGFMHYPGEFWHYNSGDVLDQIRRETSQPGRYGPVDWDPATNRVTAFEDPHTSLVDNEMIARELDRAMKARQEN